MEILLRRLKTNRIELIYCRGRTRGARLEVVPILLDPTLDEFSLCAFGVVLGQDPINLRLAPYRVTWLDVAAYCPGG